MNDKEKFEGLVNEISLEKRLKYYEDKYGPYIEKRGLQNWRNLFRKPNMLEWTIFFMLVMGLFIAWAYHNDISQCQEVINQINEDPCYYCILLKPKMNINSSLISSFKEVNLTGLKSGESG